MTDQPANPNEFILIAAYRKVHHATKTASLSVFKAACKKARLSKTVIDTTNYKVIKNRSCLFKLSDTKLLIHVEAGNYLMLIDAKKLLKDLSRQPSSATTTTTASVDLVYTSMTVPEGIYLASPYRDSIACKHYDDELSFIDGHTVTLTTKSPAATAMMPETAMYSLKARGIAVWGDHMQYASKDDKALVVVDLISTVNSGVICERVYASVVCFGFDVDSDGILVGVSESGVVSKVDLKMIKHDKLESSLQTNDISDIEHEDYQAVAHLRKSVLIASFSNDHQNSHSVLSMTMVDTRSLVVLNKIEVSRLVLDDYMVLSILAIKIKLVDFAIVVGYLGHVTLLAIRKSRIEVIEPKYTISNRCIDSCCVYGKIILLTCQEENEKFIKLSICI